MDPKRKTMKEEIQQCPFCPGRKDREILLENELCYATYDKFPVSKGHTLIIPKRHCSNYFGLTTVEQSACWNLMNRIEEIINEIFTPDGFNIGINIGEYAGQTISHVHIHLIPRYQGDVREPKGGVRGVIPRKKKYPYSK